MASSFNKNDKNFGEWEKNTKGIGSKLLLKMGFQPGKGLGKDLQGISTPIEAKPKLLKGNKKLSDDHEDEIEFKKASKSKEINQNKQKDRYFPISNKEKKKINYTYDYEGLVPKVNDEEFKKIKVIDLCGPEQKVYTGYQELHQKFKSTETTIEPHNFMIEIEDEIDEESKFKNKIDYEENRLAELVKEKKNFQIELNFYKKKKDSLELIIEKISFLDIKSDLGEVLTTCETINDNDIVLDVFYTFGFPILKNQLRNWNIFDEPNNNFDDFARIKLIFSFNSQFYDQIVWDCLVPFFKIEIDNYGDMRQSSKIISFLDLWVDLIPKWIIDNLLKQNILNKLEQQIIDWNPMTDKIPIHFWIHPWLPWLKDHNTECIYEPIRNKLKKALGFWSPSDRSAKIILQPWKNVFGSKTWNSFIKESILIKLEQDMSNFVVNPNKQNLDSWYNLIDWKDMAHDSEIISILKKYFFPKWLKVLYNWLNNKPDFKEVSDWYLGWKKLFPSEWFNKELVVCQGFTLALHLINHCLDYNGQMISFDFKL